jgi:Flp pilus assembly protein TadG
MVLVVILGIVEMSRMLLVYTTIASAARAGARYAIVHGSDRTGTGVDGPSSSSGYSQVSTLVNNFASAGTLNASGIATTVTYPDSNSNAPGSRVTVKVAYTYDPLMGFFTSSLNVPLSSISYGVITY